VINDGTEWANALLKDAPDKSIAEKVGLAVQQLIANDADLFIHDLHERTVTGRLADHLRPHFPEWHVDCEYNREGHEIKRVNGNVVVPDIIVHRRGTQDNLLVIEAKNRILGQMMRTISKSSTPTGNLTCGIRTLSS
jgi:hypothetical protein